MEHAINNKAKQTYAWLENDYPARRHQDPVDFTQRRARIPKMMKHIEQYDGGYARIRERQVIGVFYPVNPWIGKNVSANALGNRLSDVYSP